MPITKLPRIGLYSDLTTGSSGWGPQRNYNSNRLEQLVSCSIIDEVATSTALPALPNDGDQYYVQDTKKIASFILGSWFQDDATLGLIVYNSSVDGFYYFNGTSLIPVPGTGTGDVIGPGSSVDGNIVIFDGTSGTQIKDIGQTITVWGATAWTPTGSWVANTTYTGIYRRMWDVLQARVDVTATANIGSQGNLTINLPASHTIDTTKLVGISTFNAVGYGTGNNDSSNDDFDLVVRYATTTTLSIHFKNFPTTMVEVQTVDDSSPITWSTDDSATLYFEVPIVEYA